MLRAIFAPSTNMSFDNIATIEERHFPIGLHPHLVSSMRSYYIQCCNVKSEFAGFREPNDISLVFCSSKLRYIGRSYFPRQVPTESRFGRAILVARLAMCKEQ